MVRAGLGLGLHDTLYGSDYVRVYDAWWEYMRTHYYPIRDGELVGPTTAYYDPLLSVHQPGDHEPFFKLFIAKCALPRFPGDAHVLFESAARYLNWREDPPLEEPDDESAGSLGAFDLHYGLFFAREVGDHALYAKLKAYSEAHHQPTWDESSGEFYWGFGLNEPHPRGQLNGAASMAEADPLSYNQRRRNRHGARSKSTVCVRRIGARWTATLKCPQPWAGTQLSYGSEELKRLVPTEWFSTHLAGEGALLSSWRR